MKYFIGLFTVLLTGSVTLQAQNDTAKNFPVYRVGIFAPLYLDSVFSNNTFRYKEGVPKFIMPSIDFVQGALVALDSMKMGKENVKAFIYDTKSYSQGLSTLIKNKKLDSLDLLIGSVRDADYKQLSDFALQKNVPFISATYPNDGGVTANPFTVILNSTLKAHCEAMYSYLLQNHGTDLIYLCRQKGTQEDKVAGYFKQLNEQDGKPLLQIQTLNTDSVFTAAALLPKLDSNRQCIIIGASLDENFAKNLAAACYELHESYPLTLIGMPNWDGFTSLYKKEAYEDFPIHFTTPYFNNKWDNYSKMLTAAYQKKYKMKPGDMAFKGFETVQLFTRLYTLHPADFMSHLNDKTAKVFCDYNIKPVMLAKGAVTPDYFENKHLYFVKIVNGTKQKAW
jgi:Periplasmic binding protein